MAFVICRGRQGEEKTCLSNPWATTWCSRMERGRWSSHQIVGNTHHDGLIMAYLRKEKLLIDADAYTPGAAAPKTPNSFSVNLEANVGRLRNDVDRISPLHGRIVPYGELLNAIGKKPAAAKK
jgi:hypothetical protein